MASYPEMQWGAKRQRRRRGVALLLVLSVIGITFILGAALLSNTAIQARVAFNQNRSYQADCLAEGGINLAEYYLLNPAKAPVLNGSGYYPGETGITLTGGTVTTTVSLVNNTIDNYAITSTGTAGTAANLKLSRKISGSVQVRNATIRNAIISNASLEIPSNVTVTGTVVVNGTLTVDTGATITGSASAVTAGTVKGTITGGAITLITAPAISVTPTATLTNYTTYKYYNGSSWGTYSAQTLAVIAFGGSMGNVALTSSVLNPAGIYYYSGGNLALHDNVTITGTLLVTNGNLTIAGQNGSISPVAGYPGLIVQGNLVGQGSNNTLTVNGLTWVSGILTNIGATYQTGLTVKGALMFGGSSASISSGFGFVNVTYNSKNLSSLIHLNTANDTVQALSWSQ